VLDEFCFFKIKYFKLNFFASFCIYASFKLMLWFFR